MDMKKIAEAEKILYDIDMEEQNWRKARLQVGELLAACREAHKEIADLDATRNNIKLEITNLGKQLEAGHTANKKKFEAQEMELRGEIQRAEQKLADLGNACRESEKELDDNEEARVQAQADREEAERQLLIVNKKVEEAKQLLARLTKVGE